MFCIGGGDGQGFSEMGDGLNDGSAKQEGVARVVGPSCVVGMVSTDHVKIEGGGVECGGGGGGAGVFVIVVPRGCESGCRQVVAEQEKDGERLGGK